VGRGLPEFVLAGQFQGAGAKGRLAFLVESGPGNPHAGWSKKAHRGALGRRAQGRDEQRQAQEQPGYVHGPDLGGTMNAAWADDKHSGGEVKARLLPHEGGTGATFQMSRAYSLIVRSLENLPIRATFRIALRAQAWRSRYSCDTCS